MELKRIISGGQTGSDRGGLDAAIHLHIPHGGWCPRGRKAEDGSIPSKYKLKETGSQEYPVRTELNIVDSDATIVFTFGKAERGSALTLSLCQKHKKPSLHIDLLNKVSQPHVTLVSEWLKRTKIEVLNVAGNRESVSPGIQQCVAEILIHAIKEEDK